MDRLSWRRYASAGSVVLGGYLFVPDGLARDLVYLAVGLSAVGAIGLGLRIHAPARRRPWVLMAGGLLVWVMGDAVGSWHSDIEHSHSFPAAADGFYLAAYPLLATALFLLIRSRRPRRDLAGLLDSAMMTAGLGVVSWVVLAEPTWHLAPQSLPAAVTGAAYPVADILLAGLLIRLTTGSGSLSPSLRLLLGAVALLIAGDTCSTALNVYGPSATSGFDLIWLASYLAWGAAALHPSMYSLSEPAANDEPTFTRARYVALIATAVTAPATLLVQYLTGHDLDLWPITVGAVVSFVLVMSRMNVALEQLVATNRQRVQVQGEISHLATHDDLTGLPNRAQALPIIDAALHRATRSHGIVGVLLIDLDDFKIVNDNLGTRAGDDVLRIAGNRIQAAVRLGDIVARMGGDEFIVILEGIDSEATAVDIAERLVMSASVPITLSGRRDVRVGASIGVAINESGSVDVEALLLDADAAVIRAKAAGGGRVEIYGDALRREIQDRAELESAIAYGLVHEEFLLDYQPIVNVGTDAIEGYEALVRWDRPGVGLVSPGEFIPTAERSDLINDLDTWVLQQATVQLAAWNRATRSRHLTMAVNISGRHVCSPRIVEDVVGALREAGIPARQLILEITESAFIDHTLAIAQLEKLRHLGVAISLDDFGTGFSSISRLQELPIDIIKIDKRFLDATQLASDKLLSLMVQAAHAFGLPVVAEGVEYDHQMTILREIDCESAQGFHLARPMTATDVERHLSGVWHTNYN